MAKSSPAQRFAKIYAVWIHKSTSAGDRANAKRQIDNWLKHYRKTINDIPEILVQAAADDAAQAPSPPPSDPRDAQPHPFEDPKFTPVGLVHGIVGKYLTMTPHVQVIYSLYIVATHVYRQFDIAARLALVSELPGSGKSEALKVAKCLMLRPNPEALSTGAAVIDFIDAGPCTIGLDELDLLDAEARQYILLLWNLGHDRALAKRALMVKGKRKVVDFHAPMMAAGLGSFLADAQMTRTFILEMHKYTAETKPERKFKATDTADLDAVYSFLRHRTANMKLNLDPPMPPGVIARDADNACSLLAVADACGPEWGQRAREAILFLIEKARTEQPKIRMIRHGLAIFDALGIKQIRSTQFNKELKRLDLPDADWTRYRDLSGLDKAHPLTMNEQVKLLGMVGIAAKKCTPPGEKQFRGYTLAQFEEADRVYCASGAAAPRLRLITPPPIRASFPSHASRRGCDRRAIEGRLGHLGRPYRGGGIAGATDRRKESIMKVINEPGLAKVSSTDLLHELTNELVRVRRRLKRARLKFAGLQALKRDLQPYLQSGDYEHLLELLKREIERREREETELSTRCRDERFRQAVGDERFEKSRRELAEIHRKLGLD